MRRCFTEVNIADRLSIDAQNIVTGRGCAIGQSGSGKSFLVGVVLEELCKLNMPFCVIDTEGEYNSLKNSFNVIVVGGSNKDMDVDINYSKLFNASIYNNIPVVLDVSDAIDKNEIVYNALQALYDIENKLRKPYLVVIEEADKFAPQVTGRKMNIVEELSVRGRKRGVGLLVVTQRPATVSKNVLAQCSYGFIGKLTIDNDINAVKILFEDKHVLNEITRLGVGEFLPFGLGPKNQRFKVKSRITKAISITPSVQTTYKPKPKLDSIIRSIEGETTIAMPGASEKGISALKDVEVLRGIFSTEDAKRYAERISKKKFLMFGRSVEDLDTVQVQYMPVGLCKVRIPTERKNEYMENYVLIDKDQHLVSVNNEIRFIKSSTGKRAKLSDVEIRILSEISAKNGINASRLIKSLHLEESEAYKALDKLEKHKLIIDSKGKLSTSDYRKYIVKWNPTLEKTRINVSELSEDKLNKAYAENCINSFFPGADLVSFKKIYIKIYKIALKSKNRVRVFTLESLHGKEIDSSLFKND